MPFLRTDSMQSLNYHVARYRWRLVWIFVLTFGALLLIIFVGGNTENGYNCIPLLVITLHNAVKYAAATCSKQCEHPPIVITPTAYLGVRGKTQAAMYANTSLCCHPPCCIPMPMMSPESADNIITPPYHAALSRRLYHPLLPVRRVISLCTHPTRSRIIIQGYIVYNSYFFFLYRLPLEWNSRRVINF